MENEQISKVQNALPSGPDYKIQWILKVNFFFIFWSFSVIKRVVANSKGQMLVWLKIKVVRFVLSIIVKQPDFHSK